MGVPETPSETLPAISTDTTTYIPLNGDAAAVVTTIDAPRRKARRPREPNRLECQPREPHKPVNKWWIYTTAVCTILFGLVTAITFFSGVVPVLVYNNNRTPSRCFVVLPIYATPAACGDLSCWQVASPLTNIGNVDLARTAFTTAGFSDCSSSDCAITAYTKKHNGSMCWYSNLKTEHPRVSFDPPKSFKGADVVSIIFLCLTGVWGFFIWISWLLRRDCGTGCCGCECWKD